MGLVHAPKLPLYNLNTIFMKPKSKIVLKYDIYDLEFTESKDCKNPDLFADAFERTWFKLTNRYIDPCTCFEG